MGMEKSWTRLEAEIADTFRKWRALTRGYVVESVLARAPDGRRKARQRGQSLDDRRVTLRFQWWDWEHSTSRTVVLSMQREERAIDNLRLLAGAIEWIRVADERGLTGLVVKLYRQMYPEPERTTAPPAPSGARALPAKRSSAYATLHLTDDAPLEVAEAAFKALVRTAHPDSGGSNAAMVALNTAIQQIRAEKARD
jgi:hypothetical protein